MIGVERRPNLVGATFLPSAGSVYSFILINLFIGLFNLLPIPPFDGSHIVEGAAAAARGRFYEKLRPYGMGLLFVLLLVIPCSFPGLGIVERVVVPPVQWAEGQFMALASGSPANLIRVY